MRQERGAIWEERISEMSQGGIDQVEIDLCTSIPNQSSAHPRAVNA
jgi:hypothetical protein